MNACTCNPPLSLKQIRQHIVASIIREDAGELDVDETETLSGTMHCKVCGQWYAWNLNIMTLPRGAKVNE